MPHEGTIDSTSTTAANQGRLRLDRRFGAATLLGAPPPPFVDIQTLSPMARGFYAENRRVATGKARRLLGWTPRYPDYRAGLRALNAITSPTPVSTAPPTASGDQR